VVSTHSPGSVAGLQKTVGRTGSFLKYSLVLILLIDGVSIADVDSMRGCFRRWSGSKNGGKRSALGKRTF
jgi:hypothetical protein